MRIEVRARRNSAGLRTCRPSVAAATSPRAPRARDPASRRSVAAARGTPGAAARSAARCGSGACPNAARMRAPAPQNKHLIRGSGFIQFPPQVPFRGPVVVQPPTVAVRGAQRRGAAVGCRCLRHR